MHLWTLHSAAPPDTRWPGLPNIRVFLTMTTSFHSVAPDFVQSRSGAYHGLDTGRLLVRGEGPQAIFHKNPQLGGN